MNYAIIENGRVANIIVATPEFAASIGAIPAEDARIGDVYENGQFRPPQVPLETLRAGLYALNERKRDEAFAAGVPYTFPDGQSGTVQTRNSTDITNINGVASAGTAMKGLGVTGPVLFFRDTENVTHMLTPEQAETFGLAMMTAISTIYQTKWMCDEAIAAAQTREQLESFNVGAYWT